MKNENIFNGDPYIKIGNLLFGAIVNSRHLLTYEGKVLMVILFKTIGFRKDMDWLNYRQICRFSGIKQKTRISEAIKNLIEKKLVIRKGKYFKVNQNFEEWLTIEKEIVDSIKEAYQRDKLQNSVTQSNNKLQKTVTAVTKKRNTKLQNTVTPSTDNTSDKTVTDNYINIPESDNKYKSEIEEIISYLNSKTSKNFRSDSKKTIEKIRSRLNEGYSIEDFKRVIDIKTSKWKDTEWDDYLRPETLFGVKFENYLNEKPAKSKKHFDFERDYSEEDRALINKNFYRE